MTISDSANHFESLLAFDRASYKKLAKKFGIKVERSKSSSQLKIFSEQKTFIIGVDEVGRGCLAGPVFTCAVLLPELEEGLRRSLSGLKDSKLLSATKREQICHTLESSAWYALGEASPAEIDELNILNASLLAMQRAVDALLVKLPFPREKFVVLVDGNKVIKNLSVPQQTVVKGDNRSAAIAAASVIAKVHRDSFMEKLDCEFPEYGFAQHKGYPSALHRKAIAQVGACPWHRQSFKLLPQAVEDLG